MSGPLPPAKIAGTRDFEEILLELREMIDTARTMPMSSSVLVHRDEALELLDEVLARLPEELRQARWMLKERQEYLTQARRDADDLMDAARVQAERMVERTELTREAKRASQQVVTDAEAHARRLRHEAEDYVEARLVAFEGVLERTLETIQKGRARLQVPLEPLPGENEEEDPDAAFFDQDDG